MIEVLNHRQIAELYDIHGTALVSKDHDFKIEIGDTKQAEFYPQVKLIRSPVFENEFNFSIRYAKDIQGAVVRFNGKTTIWEHPDGTVGRFYDLGTDKDGGFEFELDLMKEPADRIVPFSVRSKGLIFYPQPTLANVDADGSSWEEHPALGVCRRPANVNESLAAYFAGKRDNEYKAGKAFHLYRPRVTKDANGKEFWCDWILDDESVPIGVRIPVEAEYPLTLDPTIGYYNGGTPGGTIAASNAPAFLLTQRATATENGTLQSMSHYTLRDALDGNIALGIYSDDGDPGVNPEAATRLDSGTQITTIPTVEGWVTSTGFSQTISASANYWLSINKSVAAGLYYDSGGDPSFYKDIAYAHPLPDPHPSSLASFGVQMSLYATYATGGAATHNTRAFPLGLHRGMKRRISG